MKNCYILKKKKNHNFTKQNKTQIKKAHKSTVKKPTIRFQSLSSKPTLKKKKKFAMSIYFLLCSQYIWKVRERELTRKWLGQWCSLEMLGSGASKGVPGVDKSLGERINGWWVAQWWLVRDLVHAMMVVWHESVSSNSKSATSGFFEN